MPVHHTLVVYGTYKGSSDPLITILSSTKFIPLSDGMKVFFEEYPEDDCEIENLKWKRKKTTIQESKPFGWRYGELCNGVRAPSYNHAVGCSVFEKCFVYHHQTHSIPHSLKELDAHFCQRVGEQDRESAEMWHNTWLIFTRLKDAR